MSLYQILDKHTIIDMFCLKWTTMWYCCEKSIIAKQ